MQQTDITTHMPGDILFYASIPNDLIDVAISDWTGSPFVHVAIAISAVQKIEALSNGIMLTPIIGRNIAASWSYVSHVADKDGLAPALTWLQSMLGQPYGYGDAVEAVLYKLEHGIVLDVGDHFDCSALATEFLMKAGGVIQLQNVTNPHEQTPVMLAQLLGVK
jgi:uncharacterized protein YycO